ncbi:MAG: Ribonuclease J 2 [Tenericutes bacterium ADurb.Bin239]|nr:MAG: Ribonuclease J 2 [Tenericutes bacterium ADurb.Bin239]
MNDKVKIFALGGLDEHGKNMYVIELNNDIFVFEAGLKYPDKSSPGIDFIIPNHDYLISNKSRIKAYFISHGHDDQFGALPFIYKQAPAPIYTTKAAAMMLERFTKRVGVKDVKYDIVTIEPSSQHEIAGRKFTFFQTTHSAMHSFGIGLDTSQGTIVYSGDFIIEYTNSARYKLDLNSIAKIAEKNVLCLLSESSGAEKAGYTSPTHRLTTHIVPVFREVKGRIFISLYDQGTYNIEELVQVVMAAKRKIAFYDPQTEEYFRDFERAGLSLIDERLIISNDDLLRVRDQDIVILMLGAGARLFQKIIALSNRENPDKKIVLGKDDTFIMALPAPPTLEVIATEALDSLYTTGCSVVNITRKLFTNMHAQEEDLRMLLSLLKPKYYIPVKGLYRQQIANAQLALHSGLRFSHHNIFLLDNGVSVEFNDGIGRVKMSPLDLIPSGDVLVDGTGIGDINHGVIEDRQRLSEDGIIVMALAINYDDRIITAGPDVQMRGFVYVKDSEQLLKQIRQIFINTVNEALEERDLDIDAMVKETESRVEKYIFRETRRHPMILPLIRVINK